MENKNFLYEEIEKYLKSEKVEKTQDMLRDLDATEIVECLHQISPEAKSIAFRMLDKDIAAQVFDMLEPALQSELIDSLSSEESAQLFSSLMPDDQVHLLDELPARVARKLIQQLPDNKRALVSRLMGYKDDTVGRIMSPLYVDIKNELTVKQALERIRKRMQELELTSINTVYVTDETRRIEGALPLSAMVSASPEQKVAELQKNAAFHTVTTDCDQERAAQLIKELDIPELPVVDSEARLVGVMSADDAIDVIEEEMTDDIFDKVGLVDLHKKESDRSYALVRGNFWHSVKVRVPFLLVALAGGLLAGAVIEQFEDVLEAIAITAMFIPVVMDMGGNCGTQSSTIFTRATVLGHINFRRFWPAWLRETVNGFGMAVILGTIGGTVVHFWQGADYPGLGMAVGMALTLTITVAFSIGYLVPWALIKMGFDQAAGADPFITTIKDITGLMIYFASVAFFMSDIIDKAA